MGKKPGINDFNKLFEEFQEMNREERSDAFCWLFGQFEAHFSRLGNMNEYEAYGAFSQSLAKGKEIQRRFK